MQQQISDLYRLTPLQQGLLFHARYAPTAGAYLIQLNGLLEGALDPDRMQATWDLLLQRHPILRTSFHWAESEQPYQAVHQTASLAMHREDWRDLGPDEQAAHLEAYLAADRERPFDLSQPPLMRLALFRMGPTTWRLIWTHHHILLDGWSVGLLFAEFGRVYAALGRGEAPQLPAVPLFKEYIAWLSRQDLAGADSFWSGYLAGLEGPTPLPGQRTLVLPDQSWADQTQELDATQTARLLQFARSQRVTLATVIQAAWGLLLSRYSGEPGALFGATVAGRPPELPGAESMVGLFINTLPVRVSVEGERSVGDWLRHHQAEWTTMRRWEATPLAQIQAWSGVAPGQSLFDSLVLVENLPVSDGAELVDGLRFTSATTIGRTHYPLTLSVGTGERIAFRLEADCARLDGRIVDQLLPGLLHLLEEMVTKAELTLSDLAPIRPLEAAEMAAWNQTERPLPMTSIHGLFEAQVAATPEQIAVTDGKQSLTYDELNREANRVAHRLRSLGVGPGAVVGVSLERQTHLLAALLGILKAGAAYLPLDPAFPADRLRLMTEDAQIRLLLTQESLAASFAFADAPQLLIDASDLMAAPVQNLNLPVAPEDLAYVLYTSGSTGRPKGVEIEHRSVVNFLRAMVEQLGITAADRTLGLTTLSFDIAVLELLMPLTVGGSVAIASRSIAADGPALARFVADHGVTVMQATPTTWRLLLDAGWDGDQGLTLLSGGEALPWDLAGKLCTRSRALWNLYGPTETTVWSTVEPVSLTTREGASVPIGRPIANTQVWVLGVDQRPVPVGALGELYIGGAGLARGYRGQPERTAERFVETPAAPGLRLYRTGDLVRWLPDGRLQFHGRADHQVKVRGHRIELGEIEQLLLAQVGVTGAVVAAQTDEEGGARLVAWVTSDQTPAPTPHALREQLAEKLPPYMVPSAILCLERFPLTPNGKIDRKQLPAPSWELAPQLGRLRSATEVVLAEIWREVLGTGSIGAHTSFFDLGGHSLTATRMLSRVRRAFGREVELARFFESPTIAGLATLIDQAQIVTQRPLKGGVAGDLTTLTVEQYGFWLREQIAPASPAYLMPYALRLVGSLDVNALAEACHALVERHETLRTRIVTEADGPVQIVDPPAAVVLQQIDSTQQGEAEFQGALAGFLSEPIDPAVGPLFRIALFQRAPQEHILAFVLHHTISDGWSVGLLVRELIAYYNGAVTGAPPRLTPLPVSYRDWAHWQDGVLIGDWQKAEAAFWVEYLGSGPHVVELPTDRPRPPVPSLAGGIQTHRIDPVVIAGLKKLARTESTTLFTALYAAFTLLLSRLTGQEAIILGTPVAGREFGEVEGLIGLFARVLPLRLAVDPTSTFRAHLAKAKVAVLDAMAHQRFPFDEIVQAVRPQRDLSRQPLIQVLFALHNLPDTSINLHGIQSEPLVAESGGTKYDLTLNLEERADGLYCALEYATDLFLSATAEHLLRQYEALLGALLQQPEQAIGDLPIQLQSEAALWADLNRTERAVAPTTIHQLFRAQVALTPERPAVTDGTGTYTYAQLDRWSDQIAHQLCARGVGPEQVVGLSVERSAALLAAMLGVLKAGGIYLPLDPASPPERLRLILADAAPTLLVVSEGLQASLPAADLPVLLVQGAPAEAVPPVPHQGGPENGAYLLFTSGSTGRPKGVLVEHRSVVNFFAGMDEVIGTDPTRPDLLFAVTAFSFDISVLELLWTLTRGHQIRIGDSLLDLPGGEAPTLLQSTPSLLEGFLSTGADPAILQRLRALLVGGEALTPALVARLRQVIPGRILNMYGPTETTIWSLTYPVTGGEERIPIGRPIANTKVWLVDQAGRPVPVGALGEIVIGGAGLARGYWGRPDLTAERFRPAPDGTPGLAYWTGDLGRLRPDGQIEFFGRRDHQIKLRGHRIELGEIESALRNHPQIRQAVVGLWQAGEGDQRLVAWILPAEGEAPSVEAVRAYLVEQLPSYMHPAHLIMLDALPLTVSGKVDRQALPVPTASTIGRTLVAPRTPTEARLAQLWAELLQVEQFSIHDDFFSLGGHSLLGAKLLGRVRQEWNLVLPLRNLFREPTVAGLARLIDEAQPTALPTASIPRLFTDESEADELDQLSEEELEALLAELPNAD